MERDILVTIKSMAFQGNGVARVNGKVVFVPQAVKGETARIEIVNEKKDYCIGTLNQIPVPSPFRVTPPCPYFSLCGGCQWQHIDHEAQAGFKKEILEETLKRLGGLQEVPPVTVFPSPLAYGYRVRVQLKGQQGRMGYYEKRSHRIIPIDRCLIAHPLINQIIPWFQDSLPLFSHIKEIEVNVSPEEGRGILILHPFPPAPGMEREITDFLHHHSLLKGVAVARKGKLDLFGEADLTFTVSFQKNGRTKNLKLRTSPQSFFQIHPEQNQKLIQTVIELGALKQGERLLDLYAGIGNLTLPMASITREVTGIEEDRIAVMDARNNARANGIEGCRFIRGKVEDVLKNTPLEKPDVILLDPPRSGCKEVVAHIVALEPKRIIYVSCDPATFSRDLRLFAKSGYTLRRLTLIDLFPQTYHMEVVGLLLAAC
jgi:23S rRNA (uracil1939-C5)-methyltransferase